VSFVSDINQTIEIAQYAAHHIRTHTHTLTHSVNKIQAKHKIIFIFFFLVTIKTEQTNNKHYYFTVPFRGPPRYNPRRRSGLGWGATLSRIGGPPSPCPSEHPFSSASSSLSEGSSSQRSHEDDISIVTGITNKQKKNNT
jgi:hypothetical protein